MRLLEITPAAVGYLGAIWGILLMVFSKLVGAVDRWQGNVRPRANQGAPYLVAGIVMAIASAGEYLLRLRYEASFHQYCHDIYVGDCSPHPSAPGPLAIGIFSAIFAVLVAAFVLAWRRRNHIDGPVLLVSAAVGNVLTCDALYAHMKYPRWMHYVQNLSWLLVAVTIVIGVIFLWRRRHVAKLLGAMVEEIHTAGN